MSSVRRSADAAAAPTAPGPLRRGWDWLVARPTLAAGLCFALFVFAYLWPVLVGGKILSPNAFLYDLTPWRALRPADVAAYSNKLLSDVPTAVYPWRHIVRELLREGTLPAWNPYVFGGISLWSNPQTGLFSLFSVPLWVLPLNYGIGVGAALKLWAAGFGTYLLVRQLRLGFLPALLAGVCFSFSAINIVWLTHETLPAVAVMLPWTLWLVERIFGGGRLGPALGLAVVTAIGLGGGHPGMQVHLLAAAGTYAVLRAVFADGAWQVRARSLSWAAGGLALGALLMAFMLLPEALGSRDTIGTTARAHGSGTLPGTQMPLTAIRTVVFPDWWGEPAGAEVQGPLTELQPGLYVEPNYNERTFYAGVVALLFALVAVAARGGWRRKGPWAVLAVLGLAIPLRLPGLYELVIHLPGLELVQNQRVHFVWAMALTVLAAFGLQAMLDRPGGDRWRVGVLAGAVLVAVVGVVAAGASGADVGDVVSHFVSGAAVRTAGALALTSVGWYVLLAVGVAAAAVAAWRWPQRRAWIAFGVVLLAAADMLHFADGYQPIAPPRAIPPRTGAIEWLQEHRDEGRILGLGSVMTNDWPAVYGLRDIRGYDPPQPTRRLYRLWRRASPAQLDWQPFWISSLGPKELEVVSGLGARFLVTGPDVGIERGGGPAMEALRLVYDGEDARVYENPGAVGRVHVLFGVYE